MFKKLAEMISEIKTENDRDATFWQIDREFEQEKITAELLARDMGVTRLTAEGAYTRNDKPVLLCAVRRREIVAVKRLVNEIDPAAFFIVCDAREVLGEGFSEYKPDGL